MTSSQPNWDNRIGKRIKLRDLHVLAAVVRWGSMAKAAAHLAMSQPAVSEAVAGLEKALCVRLLERNAQGVKSTKYADVLLRRSQIIFDELRQGIKEIEFLSNPTAGEIKIACPEFLASDLLSRAISAFSEQYPEVAFHIVQQDTTTFEHQELQQRLVDIVLSRVPDGLRDDDLNIEKLIAEPHCIVVGHGSPWARRRRVPLEQLAGEPWILPPSPLIYNLLQGKLEERGGKVLNVKVTSASILLRNQLLSTGRYVSIMHQSVFMKYAKEWKLKKLDANVELQTPPISLITLKRRALSPAVQLFVEHLRNLVAGISTPARKN
jgi:DNA-binding transcriptional LysR family regulator